MTPPRKQETSYRLPAADCAVRHEIEIKRSRFITLVARAQNEVEARDFINRARVDYPDARHHCSAYYLHVDAANPIERSSDDGEPSGTAGKPMLDVVKGSGLIDVVVVVVRYFGGVKLGAGGLVHAYSGAVSEALEHVKSVLRTPKDLFTVSFPHAEAGKLEAELRNRGIHVVDTQYGGEVELTVAVDPGQKDSLAATLAALSQGRIEPRSAGHTWVELP